MKDARVVSHEFGHHVDFSMGHISSQNGIFINTINDILESLKGKGQSQSELRGKMRNIMSHENAYYNAPLSDIFCALVRANSRYDDLWGCAGHRPKDYKHDEVVRAEIFANLFSIYSQNDNLAIFCLKDTFPDIITAFLEITNGARDNDKQTRTGYSKNNS